ncbi:glycine betaine ABC transporter substrate-binding protein [Streptomyces sp. NPDC058108]|uniref:glycine betaine ABC transporter substrate-binding protein n=1 Tax=unclassified Streptomyces TaxID=2593676 RepID=UPI0036E2768E
MPIYGINPGAGISRFSAGMVGAYGLDRAGYTFAPGDEEGFTARADRGVAAREGFVSPLWRPQYLNRHHRLHRLEEPKGLLGTVDDAYPVITLEALDRIRPEAVSPLDALRPGNDGVEEIDTLINVGGLSSQQAADRYLADHHSGLLP